MRQIKLRLRSARCDIVVGAGALQSIPGLLRAAGIEERALLVSQEPVLDALGSTSAILDGPIGKLPRALIPDGERAKKLGTVERLLDRMLDLRMTRESVVIAVGGGVVGDVAGMAASLYLRGIRVVQVPTTLLAQVDSSVGGKTGVNHARGKNLIGTFHQPRLVVADPAVLQTLPDREYRSGLYEVLKYGLIADRALFRFFEKRLTDIERRDLGLLEDIVYRSLGVKARIVRLDEKEGGLRRILNFGHTIGHAIEAASGYRKVRHGEAVGYGMIGATRIASRMGLIDDVDADRIEAAVLSIGRLPALGSVSVPLMLEAIAHDKKVRNGAVHFVLPRRIGAVEIGAGVDRATLRATLRQLAGSEAR
jgi:3-dehydroquinate synthase